MSKPYSKKKCPICQGVKYGLFQSKKDIMCVDCIRKLEYAKNPHILYIYNDFFKELLYRYKGLGDLALAPVFLEPFKKYLKKRYKGYIIVIVPSNVNDNFRRGFAFLPWIFKSLNFEMISPFTKQKEYKQASSKHREDIKNIIVFKENIFVSNKKLLIVDDVITSGYTLKTCMDLLRKKHPKKIDYLVLASKKENIKKSTKLLKER